MAIQYKAPQDDIKFLINDVLKFEDHYKKHTIPGGDEATPEMVEMIISESAKFCENVLTPLYQTGDEEGCTLVDGEVKTPTGFKEAYQQFIEGGWQGLSHPVEYGGQGLPMSLGIVKSDMMATANWSWSMYPGLSIGAMNTLVMYASDEQKKTYLTKLTEGTWTGTMCLTEPHCGTDLAQLKTKAVENEDGSYTLSGTKIFISSGDHDLTDNKVHIVIAKTPDMPDGIDGISLFIVPKFLPDENGEAGEFNNVNVGSLEHKMGINGSATCVLNFDESKAFMIGPKGKGLMCMFTFMNTARIGTGLQGVASAELAYQNALPYAKERKSMHFMGGGKKKNDAPDEIIKHADVRRMLLTAKAIAEGGRSIVYETAMFSDIMTKAGEAGDEAGFKAADDELGFYTPVAKGFITELGLESANQCLQVFGGHGYIKEWGMEQIVRDARIATLYEGTTGIQSLDLIGRKVLLDRFKQLNKFIKRVLTFSKDALVSTPAKARMAKLLIPLTCYAIKWKYYAFRLGITASRDQRIVGSAANDFLYYSGYVTLAFHWARMAAVAHEKLAKGEGNTEFYKSKIETAEFYFSRLLPRAKSHATIMMQNPKTVLQMKEENF
ncbi:MAG: acyl-CoA dehydrogenase C-terminal domain-containing protein [Pseudomonadota bacterium]